MLIRPATHADIPFIIENLVLAWKETNHPMWSQRRHYEDYVERKVRSLIDEHCSFVCDAGHLLAFIEEDMFDPTLVYSVPSMFIRKEYRNKGAAVRMLNIAQKFAKAEGCGAFEVGESSGINSDKVRDMYNRMGFSCRTTTYMKDI